MLKYTTEMNHNGLIFSLTVEASIEALRRQCEDLLTVEEASELEESFLHCFLKMPALLDQVRQEVLKSLLTDSCLNLESKYKAVKGNI